MAGSFLPWRDVLHEGPVRAGLALEELSRERAAFIAEAGWGRRQEVLKQFQARELVNWALPQGIDVDFEERLEGEDPEAVIYVVMR